MRLGGLERKEKREIYFFPISENQRPCGWKRSKITVRFMLLFPVESTVSLFEIDSGESGIDLKLIY